MFFKIAVLKNFAISQKNTCAGRCRSSYTEHLRWLLLDFRSSKYFFQLTLVFIADSRIGFLLRTPLETLVKRQKQPLKLFCKKSCF